MFLRLWAAPAEQRAYRTASALAFGIDPNSAKVNSRRRRSFMLCCVDLHCITIRLSSSVGYSFKLAILRCAVGIGQHDGDRTVRVCAPTARRANVDA
jgi:hypothetical protein